MSSRSLCIAFILFLPVLCFAGSHTYSPDKYHFPAHVPMPDGSLAPVRNMLNQFPVANEEGTDLERTFMEGVLDRAVKSGKAGSIPPFKFQELVTKAGRPYMEQPRQGGGAKRLGTPDRGGVGYGFWYNDQSFRWTDITVCFQNMIVPRKAGGDVYYFLYNTTTNRSELGVEAFLSYYSQDDVRFKVFDWARTDHWQTDIPYANLGEYICSKQNTDGTWRQLIKVVNVTRRTGGANDWINEVYLYNCFHEAWDYVYHYNYTTSSPTENTFETGDFYGSWAPIFETFQDHDGSSNPIGWDDTRLYQDGVFTRVLSSNSWLQVDDPDLTPPIFLTPNYGWAVGTKNGESVNQVFQAEDGDHDIGQTYGYGWFVTPAHGAGYMLKGPGWTFSPVRMNAEFRIGIDDSALPTDLIAQLGVWDNTTGSYVVSDDLYGSDFSKVYTFLLFRYDFTPVAGHEYWFTIYAYGNSAIGADKIVIVKN